MSRVAFRARQWGEVVSSALTVTGCTTSNCSLQPSHRYSYNGMEHPLLGPPAECIIAERVTRARHLWSRPPTGFLTAPHAVSYLTTNQTWSVGYPKGDEHVVADSPLQVADGRDAGRADRRAGARRAVPAAL